MVRLEIGEKPPLNILDDPTICQYCDKKFSSISEVQTHYSKFHKIDNNFEVDTNDDNVEVIKYDRVSQSKQTPKTPQYSIMSGLGHLLSDLKQTNETPQHSKKYQKTENSSDEEVSQSRKTNKNPQHSMISGISLLEFYKAPANIPQSAAASASMV